MCSSVMDVRGLVQDFGAGGEARANLLRAARRRLVQQINPAKLMGRTAQRPPGAVLLANDVLSNEAVHHATEH